VNRYVCIHGHFYQPPRENPWLEEIEIQEAAYPYHNWNDKILAECYAPNTAARIMSPERRILAITNNYSKMSFNFGPTLLSWIEHHEPELYQAILEADKWSATRFSGHGSAIAQAYNHLILPLANKRDKHTQVKWGIKDFERHFKRSPEGMWLPETAMDMETLEVLATQGIKFTILAPHQAAKVRKLGEERWDDVSGGKVDPKRAYLCKLPSGRSINVFFYDAPISHDIAFGCLLENGVEFAKKLMGAFSDSNAPQLVHVATDGETYGHHHRFGDMALAFCLHHIESQNLAKITNYGEFLEKNPPQYEVQVIENTSWSCAHGIERWRSNCGCNTGKGWSQEWRLPLRETMDWLRDSLIPLYESESSKYLKNPWKARDEYIAVIMDRSRENVEAFLTKHSKRELSPEERRVVLKLLESQRHAMLMYTSCGWFFDEISGIETVQVMKYAARAIQLAKEINGTEFEPGYLERLGKAKSNIPELENGAKVYEWCVKPASMDLMRVGVHYAISSIFEKPESRPSRVYCYLISDEIYELLASEKLKLATGRAKITSDITWDEQRVSFAVFWLGDYYVYGGARAFISENAFTSMRNELQEVFEKGEDHRIILLIDANFQKKGVSCSLKDLFKDRQLAIISKIMELSLSKVKALYREIFESNHSAILFLKEIRVPLPRALKVAAEVVLGSDILEVLRSEELNLDLLERLVCDTQNLGVEVDRGMIGLESSTRMEKEIEKITNDPFNRDRVERAEWLLTLLFKLNLPLNLWRAQNAIFTIIGQSYGYMEGRSKRGDKEAERWVASFQRLAELLGVKI